MNKVTLSGRLTATPELKKTQSGISVCSFSLAVKRPRVKDTTDFINCVAWRQKAEFITRYFKKGDAMEVEGVLESRKYQDNDGKNRTAWEVKCEDVDFALTNTKTEAANTEPENSEPESTYAPIGGEFIPISDDDDLPF